MMEAAFRSRVSRQCVGNGPLEPHPRQQLRLRFLITGVIHKFNCGPLYLCLQHEEFVLHFQVGSEAGLAQPYFIC